jgi:copper transport protein
VVQALLNVPTLEALVATTYGRLLCAKIALLVVALGFAFVSRRRVRAGATNVGGPVRAELLVLLVVVAVTGALVESPPARGSAVPVIARSAFAIDDLAVAVETDGGPGPDRAVEVRATRAGAPGSADEVVASASETSRRVGPLPIAMRAVGPGRYRGTIRLPFGGTWRAFISVRVGEFDEQHTTLPL